MNENDMVRVPVEVILQKMSQQSGEQSLKIATLQASNAQLQEELMKKTKQLDDAQIMVDSLLKKNMDLTNRLVETGQGV